MGFPETFAQGLRVRAAKLGLRPEDVSEAFVRGSGAGGQKINKTNSRVQLIHRPTGVQVHSQQHREQSANRLTAWRLLVEKLEERVLGKQSKRAKAIFKLRKQKARRTRRGKEKMLKEKHHRADIKEGRKSMV